MVQDIVRTYAQGEVVLAATGPAAFTKETASSPCSASAAHSARATHSTASRSSSRTTACPLTATAHVTILTSGILPRLSG